MTQNIRHITIKKTTIKNEGDCFVQGTPSELVGYAWELTRETIALGGKYDAERRLQRNVTSITRRGC
jgi:hypothetical protein